METISSENHNTIDVVDGPARVFVNRHGATINAAAKNRRRQFSENLRIIFRAQFPTLLPPVFSLRLHSTDE